MSEDNPRQEDATTADLSRPVATGDDTAYSLSVDEALGRYEAAGLKRTPRSIQRYCAKGHLDAHRVDTPFGEKFLISPASVDRHIAYIFEVRPVATGRDLTRQVATREALTSEGESKNTDAEPTADEVRQAPTDAEQSQLVAAADERYVAMLERENKFLHEQIDVKDEQIRGMAQHLDQSNALTGALHKLLTPLLGRGGEERVRTYTPNEEGGDNSQAA